MRSSKSASAQRAFQCAANVVAECNEKDAVDRVAVREHAPRLADGDVCRGIDRIAVDAATDGRKRNRSDAVLDGHLETAPVARRQQVRLPMRAATPDRTDGVDNELRRQAEAGSDLRVAGVAAAEEAAGGDELGAGGAVDGAIDASSAEE